jgi:hypothetical protein
MINQIIKCRDDKMPVILSPASEDPVAEVAFKLADESESSWLKRGETVGPEKLRTRIEPWLTALFQSEHLALLVGSGLTYAAHHIATGKSLPGMTKVDFGSFSTQIDCEAKRSAQTAGRGDGNIEDQIRVANELLRGLAIMGATEKALQGKAAALAKKLNEALGNFATSLLLGENGLITAQDAERNKAFNYLVSFLMSLRVEPGHGIGSRSSRPTTIASLKRELN